MLFVKKMLLKEDHVSISKMKLHITATRTSLVGENLLVSRNDRVNDCGAIEAT
jgi:hypothetical protein